MTITRTAPAAVTAEAHVTWFADARRILDVTEVTPGLPLPRISPARASFDYRHVVRAEDAREAVTRAAAILGCAFGTGFAERTETGGDGTPRYLLEALLPSGLTLVIISRLAHAAGQDTPGRTREPVAA